MGKISKSLALVFLLFCVASPIVLPQNAKALSVPALTLNATAVTETTVTLTWPNTHFLPTYSPNHFQSYTLYMWTASDYYNGSAKLTSPVFSTSDPNQTTTTILNLVPSTGYVFYVRETWSNGGIDGSDPIDVQTLPIPTLSPNPTPTPTVPEFPTLAITFLIVVLAVGGVVNKKKACQQTLT